MKLLNMLKNFSFFDIVSKGGNYLLNIGHKGEQGNNKTTIHLPNQLPDASATVIRFE